MYKVNNWNVGGNENTLYNHCVQLYTVHLYTLQINLFESVFGVWKIGGKCAVRMKMGKFISKLMGLPWLWTVNGKWKYQFQLFTWNKDLTVNAIDEKNLQRQLLSSEHLNVEFPEDKILLWFTYAQNGKCQFQSLMW